MEGKRALALLCVLWSVFCVTECVRRDGTRRRRRETCADDGLYSSSSGLQCCRCPIGHHLVRDCTSNGTAPECDACERGSYLDHANALSKCEPCKTCGVNDNMIEEKRCTPASNAMCRCMDGYYCDKGAECKVCYPCSTCEFGIKVPCNLTSDAQCHEQGPNTTTASIIIPILIIAFIIIIIIIAAVVYLWKKKLFCFKPPEPLKTPEPLDLLIDKDLGEFLPKISEILGVRVILQVVRQQRLLSEGVIDNITVENPHDASERAYHLLKAWYEKHGKTGAYRTLRENLIAIGKRSKADEVRELIGERENNNVT
ncbi:Fas cell surface death receptor precursor [Ictalurus punctatus]|uniref:Tumor necrosis factor receptor superfamily member 6 n=1 Tax=Ictalurus punctatus TaxID=7998 RepID=Q6E5U7_ICTPU|nr:Fas cell surface death receptor precursor [Ictalurus punctatus]AAT36327.1 Fas receptor [Ictalurus punctatus]